MTDPISVKFFAKDVISKIQYFDNATQHYYHQEFLNIAQDVKTLVQAYESIIAALDLKDPMRLPPIESDTKGGWEN